MREVTITSILQGFNQKSELFLEGCYWFKFNYLGLVLDMALRFYAMVEKGLKLQVRKFWRVIPTFVEVTGEKMVGRGRHFATHPK